MNARFSDTEERLTPGFFFNLNVTLGTSLFLPFWMPASNQPDETSVT